MPMGRICWRNTARLSWNKTIKPKPIMQTMPPLATICRLLKAMSGVTESVPDWLDAVCCKFKPCITFRTKPYIRSAKTMPMGRGVKKRFMDQLSILLV